MDSGASDHMTSSLQHLTNVVPADAASTINLPTGAATVITHVGDLLLSNGLKLNKVLYVPQFQHNLLSIHKLAAENNCNVKFHQNFCEILDNTTNVTRATGNLVNGLYYLSDTSQHVSACTADKSQKTKIMWNLWHHRLGHVSRAVLSKISAVKEFVSFDEQQICVTCPLAKFSKLSYDKSFSYADGIFDLVHVDTWGPYRTPTREKYKYFLTVVDDHFRMVWVYLMQHKSEFFSKIRHSITMCTISLAEA